MVGQQRSGDFPDYSVSLGMVSGTVSSSAVAITALTGWASTLSPAVRATVTARLGGVMFTYDGATTPTANIGHYLGANQSIVVYGTDNINNLKFIREASTDSAVSVTLEG